MAAMVLDAAADVARAKKLPPVLGGPHRPTCRCSSCQLARGNRWYHYSSGGATREEAIERMHDDYDRHPGRRRTPSREWCEVYRVREIPTGDGGVMRILYVRKKRTTKNGGTAGSG